MEYEPYFFQDLPENLQNHLLNLFPELKDYVNEQNVRVILYTWFNEPHEAIRNSPYFDELINIILPCDTPGTRERLSGFIDPKLLVKYAEDVGIISILGSTDLKDDQGTNFHALVLVEW